jgi:YfiH family protein
MVSPRQIHSARVRRVGVCDRGTFIPSCDALITDDTEVSLLLRFADCVPILLCDPRRGAIGLAHAGWRGTLAGIAQATVQAMTDVFGSRPCDLLAGIGPAIGRCCYEIGPDVVCQVETVFGPGSDLMSSARTAKVIPTVPARGAYPGAPELDSWRGTSLHFDLWAANERLLRAAGVVNIEVAGLCTACHRSEFFSYRAQKGRVGHHGALLSLLA